MNNRLINILMIVGAVVLCIVAAKFLFKLGIFLALIAIGGFAFYQWRRQ